MQDKKTDRHILMDLLRILFSFEVVLLHYWTNGIVEIWNRPFRMISGYAVPVFMVLSFYLNAHHFFEENRVWLRRRIKRLLIPHILWALIYYGAYCIIEIVFSEELCTGQDLFWQITTGHSFNAAMWYQWVSIILTLTFYCLFHKCQYPYPILVAIALIAVIGQYTNTNFNLFHGLRYELRFPLGRIAECVPFAVAGLLIARHPKLQPLQTASVFRVIFVSLFVIISGKLLPVPSGFHYQGLTDIGVALAIVGITVYADSKITFSTQSKAFFAWISRYTFGIYCLHNLVGKCMERILSIIAPKYVGSFGACIVIYLLCFAICATINKIPLRNIKILVN